MIKILKLLFGISLICSFNYSFAATVDHFDVKLSSEETAVNKAVDVTIEAKDIDGNTVKDYKGPIVIMSETDPQVQLPAEIKDNLYNFTVTDQGKVKFENALIFKSIGEQQINVFDFNNENAIGVGKISVVKEENLDEQLDISIISPEDGVINRNNYITISGKTTKNHQVVIKLASTKTSRTIKTNSDNDGLFENKIENLEDGEYTINASVLNSELKEVGKTNEIKFTVKTKKPELESVKITPLEIYPEDKINIELKATPKLSEATLTINDEVITLKEIKAGVYTGSTIAPKQKGDYDINVNLLDDIGGETTKKLDTKLTVLEKLPSACDPELDENCEIDCDPELEDCEANTIITKKKIYKVSNLSLTKLKTKSILSWDPISEATSYNIYKQLDGNKLVLIDTVKEPRYEINIVGDKITYDNFLVEPIIINGSGETIKGELSQITEIQTGPKELMLLIFLSFIIGFIVLLFKKYKTTI